MHDPAAADGALHKAGKQIARAAAFPVAGRLAGAAASFKPDLTKAGGNKDDHIERVFAICSVGASTRVCAPHRHTAAPIEKDRFAADSSLEGDGFELSVPHERGRRFELSFFVYVPETVRVLAQRSTLLGAGGSKSRVPPGQWANSRSLENALASAERPDGASGNRKFESISLQRRVGRTLTGVRIGWVLSRENRTSGTPHWRTRSSGVRWSQGRRGEPQHPGCHPARRRSWRTRALGATRR